MRKKKWAAKELAEKKQESGETRNYNGRKVGGKIANGNVEGWA